MNKIAPQVLDRWKTMATMPGRADITNPELYEIIDRLQKAEKIAEETNSALSEMMTLAVRLRDRAGVAQTIADDFPTVCKQIEELSAMPEPKVMAYAKNLATNIQHRIGRKKPDFEGFSPDIFDLLYLIDHITADLWPRLSNQPVAWRWTDKEGCSTLTHTKHAFTAREREKNGLSEPEPLFGYKNNQPAAADELIQAIDMTVKLETMDAAVWAAEFKRIAEKNGHTGMDEGWLLGWFANAIMRGYDTARNRYETPLPAVFDVSQSSPKLHELYVNWAMHHLKVINKFARKISRFNYYKAPLLEIESAIGIERRKLITYNTAYRDAAARLMAGLEPKDDDEISLDSPKRSASEAAD